MIGYLLQLGKRYFFNYILRYCRADTLAFRSKILQSVFLDFSCNFDSDFCGLEQLSSDTFNWTREHRRTSSRGTGPGRDHTSGKGY